MSVAKKRTARDLEASKLVREEAHNSLEGYLYRVRNFLEDDSTGFLFIKCSQEKERKAMKKKLKESFNWLSEYDDVASTKDFVEQRAAIE